MLTSSEPTPPHRLAPAPGFSLLAKREIAELHGQAELLEHTRTGALVLSIRNDDPNKAFAISFRTPPHDSTGVAHIMEHSVLCGSQNFPVKEPFVQLMKGSLYTYLNAFTSTEHTTYPVMSLNPKDFQNLTRVYLDAVLLPRLTRDTYERQAWHYQPTPDGRSLQYSGVVFNEMKGNYGNPQYLLFKEIMKALFPDTWYRFDSGGDPAAIPDLTFTAWNEFHTRYYHPSNSFAVLYGDGDRAAELGLVDSYYSRFTKRPMTIERMLQPRKDSLPPYEGSIPLTPGKDPSKGAMVAVNWLLEPVGDPLRAISYDLLDEILFGSDGAPLRKALLSSGLGEGIIGGGVAHHLSQHFFTVGLQGMRPEDGDQLEELVRSTLVTLARDGISKELRSAALAQASFHIREELNSADRGMRSLQRATGEWLRGNDPIAGLSVTPHLEKVLARIAAPEGQRYFEELIEQAYLNNSHHVRVVLRPAEAFQRARDEGERARLAREEASLQPTDIDNLRKRAGELAADADAPDTPAALATIPQLKVDDLERAIRKTPSTLSETPEGITLYHHNLPTNGIGYVSLALPARHIPQDLLPYAALYTRSLFSIGTTRQSYGDFSTRIAERTGGLSASLGFGLDPTGKETRAFFTISGKVLIERSAELAAIIEEALFEGDLTNQARFIELQREEKAALERSIVPNGTSFASERASAHFSLPSSIREQMSGIARIKDLPDALVRTEQAWDEVEARLREVRSLLCNRAGAVLNVTVDGQELRRLSDPLKPALGRLPSQPKTAALWERRQCPAHEGFSIPGEIQYVVQAVPLGEVGFEPHEAMATLLNYLRATYLWNNIRIKGGAYGARVGYEKRSGVLLLGSYRDPRLSETIEVYRELPKIVQTLAFDEDELRKNIIGAIRGLDQPRTPQQEGGEALGHYLFGRSPEELQRERDQIFASSNELLRSFAPAFEAATKRAHTVVLGPRRKMAELKDPHLTIEELI